MANWAIVIGIDKYWTPSACLSGAVRDALRMREWLLEADGGGVPPANHLLLLSPKEPDEVPDDIGYGRCQTLIPSKGVLPQRGCAAKFSTAARPARCSWLTG